MKQDGGGSVKPSPLVCTTRQGGGSHFLGEIDAVAASQYPLAHPTDLAEISVFSPVSRLTRRRGGSYALIDLIGKSVGKHTDFL